MAASSYSDLSLVLAAGVNFPSAWTFLCAADMDERVGSVALLASSVALISLNRSLRHYNCFYFFPKTNFLVLYASGNKK